MSSTEKVAALDIGSNSFLCLIAKSKGGQLEIIEDHSVVTRLSQGLKSGGDFHPDALKRAEKTLQDFSEVISRTKTKRVQAMATAAARKTRDPKPLQDLFAKANIPLQIISGDEEARLTFLGLASGLKPLERSKSKIVIDMGGASTEFILSDGVDIKSKKSLPFGVVSLSEKATEQMGPLSALNANQTASLEKIIREEIHDKVGEVKDMFGDKAIQQSLLYALAGTPTTLRAMEIGQFDAGKIDNSRLDLMSLENWIQKLAPLKIEERATRFAMDPGRADVILTGAMALKQILESFKVESYLVSTRGVRFGVAYEMLFS